MYINRDTYYCKYTYQSALAAAKTSIAAMELAISEKTNTFAVVRPPGHHSGLKPQPHGFSFINNVALAARKAIKTKKASRVAIIDWDAHHGEGTQTIFYSSD
jgi:acetoin utilization deacetylase AcuC-like enzyme